MLFAPSLSDSGESQRRQGTEEIKRKSSERNEMREDKESRSSTQDSPASKILFDEAPVPH